MSDILEVRDLSVSFDGFKAVDGLDFNVEENELRCVIGPNGAGKTTLLDMICGKTRPSAGSIRFRGQELSGMIEYAITRAGVGRKFQNPSTYEDLSVFENLEISHPGRRGIANCLFGRRRKEVDRRIDAVASEIYLSDQLQTKAALLSHGQKQWLEIGMLLMQEPQLLLLDEPVAGMTDAETERTGELLNELRGRHSLMVVEHDMDFVNQIAGDGKVTVLHEGSVLAEGPMSRVQADPRVIEVYLGR